MTYISFLCKVFRKKSVLSTNQVTENRHCSLGLFVLWATRLAQTAGFDFIDKYWNLVFLGP
jgi:hypothetical protein